MIFKTLKFILNHPLAKNDRSGALWRFFRWQLKSRLTDKVIVAPFFNGTVLKVKRGMAGATGNIYCGLHEFEQMAFLIHYLRKGNTFIDLGANIGSYSILAASLGAKCVAFEPVSSTFQHLVKNIKINHYEKLIDPRQVAVTNFRGVVKITKYLDTMNHILESEEGNDYENCNACTLDEYLDIKIFPDLIKIDAENSEANIIKGAQRVLARETLNAAIVEVGQQEAHDTMMTLGFRPYSYLPFKRALIETKKKNYSQNNIYIRNYPIALEKIRTAPTYEILGQRF